MTDDEVFDCVSSQHGYGNLLNPSSLSHPEEILLTQRAGHANQILSSAYSKFGNLLPINFRFSTETSLGAFTFREDYKYYIGWPCGTEFVLLILFNRMMADRDILRGIGNSSSEKESLPLLSNLIGKPPTIEGLSLAAKHVCDPVDKFRHRFAVMLRLFAANFIVYHELAHVVQGHIEFMTSRSLSKITRQALELRADSEAIWHGMTELKSCIELAKRQPEPFDKLFLDPELAFRAWLFAIFCFCRLFGDQTVGGVSIGIENYPPFRFRQRVMLDAIAENFEKKFDGLFGTKDEVEESINSCLVLAEDAVSIVTGIPRSHDGLVEQEPVRQWKATLFKEWDLLNSQLQPYPWIGP